VSFNSRMIQTNTNLLEGIQDEKSTPEANATRIGENSKRIATIKERIARYDKNVEAMLIKAMENRAAIEANAKIIDDRRDKLMENRQNLYKNGVLVAVQLRAQ